MEGFALAVTNDTGIGEYPPRCAALPAYLNLNSAEALLFQGAQVFRTKIRVSTGYQKQKELLPD